MKRSKAIFIAGMIETLLLVSICMQLWSAGDNRSGRNAGLAKTATNDFYRPFILGNIFNYYSNNGDGSFNRYTSGSAFEFPRGSGKFAIFEEGVVWGGIHKGYAEPKVGGSVYRHGVQAGKILYPGTLTTDPVADDPFKPGYRVYSVRPDITPTTPFASVQGNLEAEAELISRYEYISAQNLYDAYVQDWNEWPAKSAGDPQGLAPFQDVNGNGTYEPLVDRPGQPGADQTLYYVANDLNSQLTSFLAGCPPIGMEMHRTIWGYNKQGALGSTIFASTLLINRSGAPIDSMFLVQWADPDLGSSTDDLVGCDTLLNLGYVYNSQSTDGVYGSAVPSAGYTLLQGPIVPARMTDSALFQGSYRQGFRNLNLSAFVMFTQGVPSLTDPRQGPGGNRDWYNLMNGRIALTGQEFIDPTTSQPTKFVAAGDPVTGTGWIDGPPFAAPEDRRLCLVTGPFTMAAEDTQEIVIATTVALGMNYLNSVSVLKSGAARLRGFLTGGVVASIAAVDTLYPVHLPITLRGSGAVFGVVVPSLEWFIASRPTGSSAILAQLDSGLAQITPDTPGIYRIGLVGRAPSANPDTAFVNLKVTSIQRPIAAFSVPSEVTLGDTITFDGSSSYDPNGIALTWSWHVAGSRGSDIWTWRDTLSGYLSSPSDPRVGFVPLRTNLHTVQLDVNNGVFTTSLPRTFEVKPKATPNILVSGQLTSGKLRLLYPNAQGQSSSGFYGWAPITEFDGQIWINDASSWCAPMNFADLEHPAEMYGVGGIIFDGSQHYLASEMSSIAYVIRTNGHGSVESMGVFLLPYPRVSADTSFRGVIVRPPYLLLTCGKAGLMVVDISTPSDPRLIGQYSNGEVWNNTLVDGDRLYALHPSTNTMSVVSIASLPSVTPVGSISFSRSYYSLRKVGQHILLSKGQSNFDTVAIYNFSNLTSAVLEGYIPVPTTLNSANRFTGVSGYGNTVITSTAEGIYLYDISNPAVPVIKGSFLTGSYFSTVFMNATHMLAVNLNRNSVGTPESAYEGLLVFQSPFTALEEESIQAVPSTFGLEQNYPNPFNPVTAIKYTVGGTGDGGRGAGETGGDQPASGLAGGRGSGTRKTRLVVYDVLGRQVAVLVDERKAPGSYEVSFDGSGLASGVYIYRLTAGSFVQSRKMLLLK